MAQRFLSSDITMAQLGAEFGGLSRERVRQILARLGITAQTRAAQAAAAGATPHGHEQQQRQQGAVLSAGGASSDAPAHGAHSAGCGRR